MSEPELIEARVAARIRYSAGTRTDGGPSGILQNCHDGPMFSRARVTFGSRTSELLDLAENAARTIRMIISELQETLVEVPAMALRAIADVEALNGPKQEAKEEPR